MTFKHISKLRRVRYFDRDAFLQEYCINLTKTGPRVVVRRWVDTGDVEVRAVTGDGRREHGLREFECVHLDRPTPERTALAVRLLASKHFA